MKDFDLIVIGSGTAAGAVVRRCAKAGWSVAVIDREPYGGTCALRGCDPKKMLRRGPEVADAARRMAGRGVEPEGLRLDWAGLQAHKRSFTDPVPEKREASFREMGVAAFHGVARFTGRETLEVDGEALRARRIVIAAGMKPRPLGFPGAELAVDSTAFLELEALPRRVLFIGGGYVSFEFAHMAARAGAEVTVLNRGPRPLKAFDPDLVDRLVERSREIGIDVRAEAEVEAIERFEEGLRVRARVAGEARRFDADLVVHGGGRVPALDELDLAAGEVRAGEGGVEVDAHLRSVSNPAVYAAGDAAATAGPPLTPVSALEGKAVAANLLEGDHAAPDYLGVPSVVFSLPPLTRVGMLEAEAREQGLEVDVRFTDMGAFFTSRRVREPAAAAKVLIERGAERVLGAHLLGPEAVELVNLFALAIRNGLDADALRNFVSAYPSGGSDLTSLL
jgi:glutathione reductase (NADPH)